MNTRATSSDFLGTGWSFPPEFGPGGTELAMVSGFEDIHQSLAILFNTGPGERPMRLDFGCNLNVFLFEEMDADLPGRIHDFVQQAILLYEPRVDLQDVRVYPDDQHAGRIQVVVDYTVRGTNSRFNFVFPFYLNEAVAPGT